MLCIIPTLMVLSFFFNSRILQTVILSWFRFWFSTNWLGSVCRKPKTKPRQYETFQHEKLAETSRILFAETSCSR